MRSASLVFSTTATWNWRGRQTIASAASSVIVHHAGRSILRSSTWLSVGSLRARSSMSPSPGENAKVTAAPTTRNATSLTTDSKAIARIKPG